MATLYEIRQKAQQAAGKDLLQISVKSEPSSRDYSAIYRAVIAYHEQHNPPRLTDEYWQSAVKGISEAAASLDNDPFIIALLEAVYSEMEREYKRLQTESSIAEGA